MKKVFFIFLLILPMAIHSAFARLSDQDRRLLEQLPDTVALNDGKLLLINVFKEQLLVLHDQQALSTDLRQHLLQRTYVPFATLWADYTGDATVYTDEIMLPLIRDSLTFIEQRGMAFARAHIDRYFRNMARKLQRLSGKSAQGTWYIAFGSGVTDMGGFGNGRMILDLSHPKTTLQHVQRILPHELNHQIYDFCVPEDTSARGLYRCINEGFAVWINQKVLGGKNTLAEYLMYTETELEYCRDNETMILVKLEPYLFTNNRDHALALADRGQVIFRGGPGAIGYYLGYRICQAYVEKHGKNAWKDIYTLPVRDVFERSGYMAR